MEELILFKLIQKQKEYIQLLHDWEKQTVGFLFAHGIQCPAELSQKGEIMRIEMQNLEAQYYQLRPKQKR